MKDLKCSCCGQDMPESYSMVIEMKGDYGISYRDDNWSAEYFDGKTTTLYNKSNNWKGEVIKNK